MTDYSLALFETDLGWTALLGSGGRLRELSFAHRSAGDAERHIGRRLDGLIRKADWTPELRRRLMCYGRGQEVHFGDVPLDFDDRSGFERRILDLCRRIPYGETRSYRQLAEAADHPKAARAVGRVMATNPIPILIPCHRVVRSDGGLGGFSAPPGVPLKRQLLRMEQTHHHAKGQPTLQARS